MRDAEKQAASGAGCAVDRRHGGVGSFYHGGWDHKCFEGHILKQIIIYSYYFIMPMPLLCYLHIFNKDCILQIMQATEEDKNNFVGMNGEVTLQ